MDMLGDLLMVGDIVGANVGTLVGSCDTGDTVGTFVGLLVGKNVGVSDAGALVGAFVGDDVGFEVEGVLVGFSVGENVGSDVGDIVCGIPHAQVWEAPADTFKKPTPAFAALGTLVCPKILSPQHLIAPVEA